MFLIKIYAWFILERFLLLPDDPERVLLKAYIVIDIAFAGRTAETYQLQWSCNGVPLLEPTTVHGENAYIINHGKRAKLTGLASANTSKIIQGDYSVRAIRNYLSCFDPNEMRTEKRFFRPLKETNDRRRPFVVKTDQPVGKNTVHKFPSKIAEMLGIRDHHLYTSHSWRRTSISIMADAGLSLPQIRSVSGHRSSKVLEGYIENSNAMRTVTSNALALGPTSSSSSDPPPRQKRPLEPTTVAMPPTITININNSNFSGSSSIFNGVKLTDTSSSISSQIYLSSQTLTANKIARRSVD